MKVKSAQLHPERSAGYQVRRSHRRFDRLLNVCLARHNIRTGYWYFLRILWIEDGVTQKFLSDMTNVAENTTAAILNDMVAEGLVVRKRNQQDRRKFNIFLTERGNALEAELMHYAAQINNIAMVGIEPVDLERCLSVLQHMSENLAAAFENQEWLPDDDV